MSVLPGDQGQLGSWGQFCEGLDEAAAVFEWKEGWALLCLEQGAVAVPTGSGPPLASRTGPRGSAGISHRAVQGGREARAPPPPPPANPVL